MREFFKNLFLFLGRYLRSSYWRMRGKCPACGSGLGHGVVSMISPGSMCSNCGWMMEFNFDGSRREYWPEKEYQQRKFTGRRELRAVEKHLN